MSSWQYTALTYSFPNFEPVLVSYPVLTVAFWTAYRFLRRLVGGLPFPSLEEFPHFVVIHTVKDSSIVNEAEVDVFLEFPCFFYDPTDVGSLISGYSAFSKSSLNIWKFLVHLLLKPSLKGFEHKLASAWNEGNHMVVSTSFGIAFLWDWNEN